MNKIETLGQMLQHTNADLFWSLLLSNNRPNLHSNKSKQVLHMQAKRALTLRLLSI